MQDPVATTEVLAACGSCAPACRSIELPELGHYPQIEDPARMATVVAAAVAGQAAGT